MTPSAPDRRPLVIGIGNRFRGDDGVGPLVADLVRASDGHRIDTAVADGDLSDLALSWDDDRIVVVVDAMTSGRPAGTVDVVDGLTADLGADRRPLSTHGVGLAEAIGLARAIGRLPRALTVVAIEGATFEHGAELSTPVRETGMELVTRIPALLDLGPDGG